MKRAIVWRYEELLYLCWAWDKELIPRGEVAYSLDKSLQTCTRKVAQLKNDGLYTKYKNKYETGVGVPAGN